MAWCLGTETTLHYFTLYTLLYCIYILVVHMDSTK